ncbi:hypothetical protein ACXR2T_10750 [Leucobacter sp. HY1910]
MRTVLGFGYGAAWPAVPVHPRTGGGGVKPRAWATHVVPEFHPETWPGLPGFEEAAARGFIPVASPPRPSRPRRVKTLAELRGDLARLEAARDKVSPPMLPDDPGALSGIARKPIRGRAAATDRALEEYARYTQRIRAVQARIWRAEREGS